MTRRAVATVTIALGDDEQDVQVRAPVAIDVSFGGESEATILGPIQAHVILAPATRPAWVDIGYLDVDASDSEHVESVLCHAAMDGAPS